MNQSINGRVGMSGHRDFQVFRPGDLGSRLQPQSLRSVVRHILPNTGIKEVDDYRLRNVQHSTRGLARIATARLAKAPTLYGVVSAQVFRNCDYDKNREIVAFRQKLDLGVLSFRVVTDTGVAFIVDAFQNTTELENMKYHGFGTGSNAEAAGNTALHTELTTQYATDNTRPTGTTTEGATANIYRTVATLSPDATVSITEHGIFSQAATGGGVLLDKSLFTAIALTGGTDSLAITYDLTFTSGS
jgi:hypothetical protein